MKRLSSYQKLKLKKQEAEEKAEQIKDDLEALILYPYSSRARGVRTRIKLENELI